MFWASKNECEIDEFIGKYDCSIRSRSVNVYVSLLLGFEDSTRNCSANFVRERSDFEMTYEEKRIVGNVVAKHDVAAVVVIDAERELNRDLKVL